MYLFQQEIGIAGGYNELWKWSIENSDEFWTKLMDFLEVELSGSLTPVKEDVEALVSILEARETKRWSFSTLQDDFARVAASLRKMGITLEDSCGAYLPNIEETIVAMLGVTSTGSIWTSSSPDFGARAVADRFSQIGPKGLFVADGYVSKSKSIPLIDKIEELVDSLPSLERIVVIPMLKETPLWTNDRVKSRLTSWEVFLMEGSETAESPPESVFERVPFSHPQFVLYSSGTTGIPKLIAHGAGNTLLPHGKELILHSDLQPKDLMIFFTTCRWMMWNWMTSSLFAGATVV